MSDTNTPDPVEVDVTVPATPATPATPAQPATPATPAPSPKG